MLAQFKPSQAATTGMRSDVDTAVVPFDSSARASAHHARACANVGRVRLFNERQLSRTASALTLKLITILIIFSWFIFSQFIQRAQ